jgi:hypothetical protein
MWRWNIDRISGESGDWFWCGQGLDGEVGGAGYGLIAEEIDRVDCQSVVACLERGEREVALEGDLFAGLLELFGGFILFPDLLVIFQDAIGYGDICFVGLEVELEAVELEEDAHFVGGGECGVDAGADFVGVQDEGALADLRRRDGTDLVGENEGAGLERFFLVERDAQGGIDGADVSALRVFKDDV